MWNKWPIDKTSENTRITIIRPKRRVKKECEHIYIYIYIRHSICMYNIQVKKYNQRDICSTCHFALRTSNAYLNEVMTKNNENG